MNGRGINLVRGSRGGYRGVNEDQDEERKEVLARINGLNL